MTNLFQQQAERQLALSKLLRHHNHQCALEHARSCRPHERLELLNVLMAGVLAEHGLEFGLQDAIASIADADNREAHDPRCTCDSCHAASSDVAHDRFVDDQQK